MKHVGESKTPWPSERLVRMTKLSTEHSLEITHENVKQRCWLCLLRNRSVVPLQLKLRGVGCCSKIVCGEIPWQRKSSPKKIDASTPRYKRILAEIVFEIRP
jgi:hypothetical protein